MKNTLKFTGDIHKSRRSGVSNLDLTAESLDFAIFLAADAACKIEILHSSNEECLLMPRETKPPTSSRHSNLLLKFALLFLLLAAAPVLVLVIVVAQQSRVFLAGQMPQFRNDLTSAVEQVTQAHWQANAANVDRNREELVRLSRQSLFRLENNLSALNQAASAKLRARFAAEAPAGEPNAVPAPTTAADLAGLERQFQAVFEKERPQSNAEFAAKIEAHQAAANQAGASQRAALRAALDERLQADFELAAAAAHARILWRLLPMMLVVGLAAAGSGILAARRMLRPLKHVTAAAAALAQGNTEQIAPVTRAADEISGLAQSLAATSIYLRKMAQGAQKIAEGDFTDDVAPFSAHDALGVAFRNMTGYLRELAALATNIAHGDLSRVVTPKSAADALGQAMQQMTVYLRRIAQVAKKVADGNLSDPSQPLSARDFLGTAFAEMIAKLRYMVAKIRTDAGQLVLISQEAQERAQEEAASVARISLTVEETSSSMTQMGVSIGEVNENMQGLASFVGETSSSIEEMTGSIRQIVLHSEQLAAASEDTSASIQQISASLQQIATTAQHSKMLSDGAKHDAVDGREAVAKMTHSMRIIQETVTVTAEAIQLLNQRTASIEKILEVIKDIAAQTALLSINASIIAKKAGERGRGFNVIADKVRKLADQSSASAKEIALIIRDVRKEAAHAVAVVAQGDEKVREGVALAELAGKALDKIIAGANESSTVIARIAETTEEQTKISQYIMESMDQVVEMVAQIKRATKEQEKSSSFIMQQAEHILLASEQVKQSTLEQTKVVKHVAQAMDDIRGLIQLTSERANASAQAAALLFQHANALKHLVSQFTI